MRGRFARRIALLVFLLFALVVATGVLGFLLFGERGPADHGRSGWNGPPIFGFVVLFGAAVFVIRLLRRATAPLGDFMEGTGRLAAGDYSARVRPHGPREVWELANSFNALAERLERTESERRDLIADIAHELRTPLSVIRGAAEGIVDGIYAGDAEHVAPIVEESEVMARLLDDLSTLSTAEAGQLSLHLEEIRPEDLLEESLTAFRPRFDAAGVSLVVRRPDKLPSLEVDPFRIRQVLSNLLTNALHHTPRGGSVTITALESEDERGLIFQVSDTGTGIPPEELPHIFDRFRKDAGSRGTGLGLAIARSLVGAHRGVISAESEAGRGTTITFRLPLAGS